MSTDIIAFPLVILTLAFVAFVSRISRFRGQAWLVISGLSVAWWVYCAMSEIGAGTISSKMMWTGLSWVGAGGAVSAYFFFIHDFLVGRPFQTKTALSVIIISAVIPTFIALTNHIHGWFFGPDTILLQEGGRLYVDYDRQPLWYAISGALHCLIFVAIALQVYCIFHSSRYFRPQIVMMLLASLLPVLANVAYILVDFRIFSFNPTPFSFLLSFKFFAFIVYGGRAFDLEALASDVIFHASDRPILVVDNSFQLYSQNRAFRKIEGAREVLQRTDFWIRFRGEAAGDSGEMEVQMGGRSFLVSVAPIKDPVKFLGRETVSGYVALFSDISRQKGVERALRDLAERDDLTRVASRHFLLNTLERRLETRSLGVLLVDVDNFKAFNDRFGHLVGDTVLRSVGEKLQDALGGWEHVGRIGGDEFLVWCDEETEAGLAARVASLQTELESAMDRGATDSPNITVSIGATLAKRGSDVREGIKRADEALYKAKSMGRDTYVLTS